MPEVQEVFRMATQKVRPEPGALDRQVQLQRRPPRRTAALVVGLAAAAAIVAVTAIVATDRGSGSGSVPAATGNGGPDAVLSLSGHPSGIAEAGGSIWVTTFDGTLYRIDPTSSQIIEHVPLDIHACGDLVVDSGAIYVSGCGYWPPDVTVRIDLRRPARSRIPGRRTSPRSSAAAACGRSGPASRIATVPRSIPSPAR